MRFTLCSRYYGLEFLFPCEILAQEEEYSSLLFWALHCIDGFSVTTAVVVVAISVHTYCVPRDIRSVTCMCQWCSLYISYTVFIPFIFINQVFCVRSGCLNFGSIRFGLVRFGSVRFGLVRFGSVLFDSVLPWSGLLGWVRFGFIVVALICSVAWLTLDIYLFISTIFMSDGQFSPCCARNIASYYFAAVARFHHSLTAPTLCWVLQQAIQVESIVAALRSRPRTWWHHIAIQ